MTGSKAQEEGSLTCECTAEEVTLPCSGGIEFSLVRTLVSLPLFIGIGYLMERYLKTRHFEVRDGGQQKQKVA